MRKHPRPSNWTSNKYRLSSKFLLNWYLAHHYAALQSLCSLCLFHCNSFLNLASVQLKIVGDHHLPTGNNSPPITANKPWLLQQLKVIDHQSYLRLFTWSVTSEWCTIDTELRSHDGLTTENFSTNDLSVVLSVSRRKMLWDLFLFRSSIATYV